MTTEESFAFEILIASHGSIKAQTIWNSWSDDQRFEATAAAGLLKPALQRGLRRLGDWSSE